jgi:hypothetical protein
MRCTNVYYTHCTFISKPKEENNIKVVDITDIIHSIDRVDANGSPGQSYIILYYLISWVQLKLTSIAKTTENLLHANFYYTYYHNESLITAASILN